MTMGVRFINNKLPTRGNKVNDSVPDYCRVRVWSTQRHTRDVKNGTHCCYVWHATLIVKLGRMPWSINRRNSLQCTVRTFQTKVVQLKGLFSVGHLAALSCTSVARFGSEIHQK